MYRAFFILPLDSKLFIPTANYFIFVTYRIFRSKLKKANYNRKETVFVYTNEC